MARLDAHRALVPSAWRRPLPYVVVLVALALVASTMLAPSRAQTVTSTEPAGGPPVIAAAGDVAGYWSSDEATASLLDAVQPTRVLALGDLANPDGSAWDFDSYYAPTWGRHKAVTSPVPGNKEYRTAGAAAYYGYFGAAAGDAGKGYYAFDLGNWRIYALNSNCDIVPCGEGSPQETWLRSDLAANPRACTLAYIHTPRFSSHEQEDRRDNVRLAALYQAFYKASGDLWLAADHRFYERFAALDPSGAVDPGRGIRNFTVGTGGGPLHPFGTPRPGSEARDWATHGVLKIALEDAGYRWEFLPEAGKTFTDAGSGPCVDTSPPTPPAYLRAVATDSGGVALTWTAATDDAGVTGYEVFRDGKSLARAQGGTTYVDSTAVPGAKYEYTVVARDEAGNVSAPSDTASVSVPLPPPRVATFPVDADARVEMADPTTNFGVRSLRTDGGADPAIETYVRFALAGLTGEVTKATLRLYATTGSVDGPAAYTARDGWRGGTVTWNSRPERDTDPVDDVGAVTANSWLEYDVTSAVRGNGTYSFALAQDNEDGVTMLSGESWPRPELVVETRDAFPVAGADPPPGALLFEDRFSGASGSQPDPSKWTAADGCDDWGSVSCNTDRSQNVSLDGEGNLRIAAVREPYTDDHGSHGEYTSARIDTGASFTFTHGTLEARIKVPSGRGLWPAFWTTSTAGEWPASGEIDVTEILGDRPSKSHCSVHGADGSDQHAPLTKSYVAPTPLSDDFHVYTATWTASHVVFMVDGEWCGTLPLSGLKPFGPQMLRVGMAVGGEWPGPPDADTPSPAVMLVDYVRVTAP